MHLHDLVTLRHKLTRALDADPIVNRLIELQSNISAIKSSVPVLTDDHKQYLDNLLSHYETAIKTVQQPVTEFDDYLKVINSEIDEIVKKLFYNNYELEERPGTLENVRNNRRLYMTEDAEQTIKNRILLHTSWRYPALEIGCRDGEWTQFLIAADPLYIIDKHPEFIESTNSRFTPEYQMRLRKYPLINHNMDKLPEDQFGFVFSWGYFNYVSLDTMKQYLQQILKLLRPGGTFMFSYNNGDTPAGAGLAENFAQTYMPKSMLIPLCESLGYKNVRAFDFEPNISALEIQKAGTLHTIKAHQVLGEIKRISI